MQEQLLFSSLEPMFTLSFTSTFLFLDLSAHLPLLQTRQKLIALSKIVEIIIGMERESDVLLQLAKRTENEKADERTKAVKIREGIKCDFIYAKSSISFISKKKGEKIIHVFDHIWYTEMNIHIKSESWTNTRETVDSLPPSHLLIFYVIY